jgi:RNA polymerase sigma-70 factor (ECF subfamily)
LSFTPLPEHNLDRLSEDQLIAYVRAARTAGDLQAGRLGLGFLVYGQEPSVRARVRMKVPAEAVEDLTSDILVRAITSAFNGQSVGEFRNWLTTITKRAIADYHRTQKRRPLTDALPEEHANSDPDVWGPQIGVPSETGVVELRMVIADAMAQLSETHRLVIELHVFAEMTAPEVCATIPGMSEANVNQIASRFRKRARERLETGANST